MNKQKSKEILKKQKPLIKAILKELETQERNVLWLSRKTDIPNGTLHSIFKQGIMALKQTHIDAINKALGSKFTLPQ